MGSNIYRFGRCERSRTVVNRTLIVIGSFLCETFRYCDASNIAIGYTVITFKENNSGAVIGQLFTIDIRDCSIQLGFTCFMSRWISTILRDVQCGTTEVSDVFI